MSDSLSPDQREKLTQFKEVTDYKPDTEQEKVLRLLDVCGWNLNTACARYFDNDFPTLLDNDELNYHREQLDENTVRRRNPTPPRQVNIQLDDRFMDLIPKLPRATTISNRWKFDVGLLPQKDESNSFSLLTPVVFVLMLFPRLLWLIGWGLDKILGDTFPRVSRLLGYREAPNDFPSKPIHITKEEISHYNITEYVNGILGDQTDIEISKQSFNEVFKRAKNELRWLMCILINSETDSAKKFIKNYMNDPSFSGFIKSHNVLVYIGDVSFPESHEVGKVYHSYSVPYICLVANVAAIESTLPTMSIVSKYQAFDKFDTLRDYGRSKIIHKFTRVIDRYEPQLVVQRTEKQEVDLARVIREEQDSAYQKSLKMDAQKQAEKKQHAKLEQVKKDEELKRQKMIEYKKKQHGACIAKFIKEKYNRDTSKWEKGKYTTIQLRNEKGGRLIRKFLKDDSVNDIFMLVECQRFIQSKDKIKNTQEDISLDGYQCKFDFDLVSPMPRLRLSEEMTCKIGDVHALWPNGSLLIERTDDESDESDN